MVGVFRRSLSFPTKINISRSSKPQISQHTRSVSLPCRSHPLIFQLNDEICVLRSWWSVVESGGVRTSTWLLDGLSRLKDVHDLLANVLRLPQTQDSLRNRRTWVENLLEDLLRFVDAYGIFRSSVLALKEQQISAQVALRKKDETKMALYFKSLNKISKEIYHLVSSIRRSMKRECHVIVVCSSYTIVDAELAVVIRDVMDVTVAVSMALFNGVYSSFGSKKTASCSGAFGLLKREKKAKVDEGIEELKAVGRDSLLGLRKMKGEETTMVLRKIRELEEGISGIENVTEKVFRSLMNTRVSFLNIIAI